VTVTGQRIKREVRARRDAPSPSPIALPRAAHERTPAGKRQEGTTMKILLVDDDPLVLEALAVGLELQWPDCTVIRARDGEESLGAFHTHHPDVVLLDVNLPRRDGFEVLRELRLTSDVPVIMLTARAEDEVRAQGQRLGADSYLIKPFSPLALLARLRSVLRRIERPAPRRGKPGCAAAS